MGDNITGDLNSAGSAPVAGVTNVGGAIEADENTDDAHGAGTGDIDVAKFPSQSPTLPMQLKQAQARAAKSPDGGHPVSQTYRAEVPFSTSKLELGSASSAGGSGASITTQGNVFIGATGKLGMQSVAAFTGQTNATMGLYSKAGTQAHSQDKFEVYSGGGSAPGACGKGGAAAPGKSVKPAEAAEKWTTIGCNALGVVKAGNDIKNAAATVGGQTETLKKLGDVATIAKGGVDAAGKGTAIGMSLLGADKDVAKTTGKVVDTTSGGINIVGGLLKLKDDPVGGLSSILGGASSISGALGGTGVLNPKSDGPVAGRTGAAGSVPGAAGAAGAKGGAGPLDIEKRAATKIHQCSNIKITGNAPEGVDWKVGGAYLVNAIAAVDFATTNWGAFAAYAFKVRSGALIDVKCRKFEMKALAKGTVKTVVTTITAKTLSTLDGVTDVTKTLTVKKHTTLHDDLVVEKDKATLLKDDLLVKMNATHKDDTKITRLVTMKGNFMVNGTWQSQAKLKASTEGKFG